LPADPRDAGAWASGVAVALALFLGTSCTTSVARQPDLGGLYNRAAQWRDDERNPVIVIPGVLGTTLKDPESGEIVWGAFLGNYSDPRTAEGARRVALPMQPGVPLRELVDDAVTAGVLESVTVSVLGLPVEQEAYVGILRSLGVGGYRDASFAQAIDYGDDHFTCFQFDYDWRRDNIENARRLHDFIREKRAYVAAELTRRYGTKDPKVRFDIVAHSMGGLLARYYLRYGAADLPVDGSAPSVTWAGAKDVERLVLVGTPNAGSLGAMRDLARGTRLSFILPRYPPAVVGTMPAIYQLLPRTRHRPAYDSSDTPVDLLDPKEWERLNLGLANPSQRDVLRQLLPGAPDDDARRAIALDHLAKSLRRAQRFHAALDVPATPPPGTWLHLFAGDAKATPAVFRLSDDGDFTVEVTAPGDDTVLRSSAIMDERLGHAEWQAGVVTPIAWNDVRFVFSSHLGMTRDPSFTDNILYQLLDAPDPPMHCTGCAP
jgi:pimeloyl-ACP methyl ester carboxylesterase